MLLVCRFRELLLESSGREDNSERLLEVLEPMLMKHSFSRCQFRTARNGGCGRLPALPVGAGSGEVALQPPDQDQTSPPQGQQHEGFSQELLGQTQEGRKQGTD